MTPERRVFSVAVYARRGGPGGRVFVIFHRRLQTWLPVGGELKAGETPLEAARRELAEETGLTATFPQLEGAYDGMPPGFIGYEEHIAGSKGLHMNFVFVADVPDGQVRPNHEYEKYRWVSGSQLEQLASPLNVRELGFLALAARPAAARAQP